MHHARVSGEITPEGPKYNVLIRAEEFAAGNTGTVTADIDGLSEFKIRGVGKIQTDELAPGGALFSPLM